MLPYCLLVVSNLGPLCHLSVLLRLAYVSRMVLMNNCRPFFFLCFASSCVILVIGRTVGRGFGWMPVTAFAFGDPPPVTFVVACWGVVISIRVLHVLVLICIVRLRWCYRSGMLIPTCRRSTSWRRRHSTHWCTVMSPGPLHGGFLCRYVSSSCWSHGSRNVWTVTSESQQLSWYNAVIGF